MDSREPKKMKTKEDTRRVESSPKLGIIGTLVGSLARQPRQNTRLGRLLELLSEEGRLLADMGRATVCPDSTNPEVNKEQVEQYHAGLENSFQEQSALALEDRKTTLLRVMTEKHNAGFGRCGERPSRSSGPRLLIPSHGHGGTAVHSLSKTVSLSRGVLFAGHRLAHTTGREVIVFRDLRRQGFYLTSAGKFGGDYLVYP
ncbi:unnamed protein product, partial [Coregonus sp. 'balchen']